MFIVSLLSTSLSSGEKQNNFDVNNYVLVRLTQPTTMKIGPFFCSVRLTHPRHRNSHTNFLVYAVDLTAHSHFCSYFL